MFPYRALPFKLLADTLSLFKYGPEFLKFSVVFNQEQQPLDESILTVARVRFVLRKFFLSYSQKRAFFFLSLSLSLVITCATFLPQNETKEKSGLV